MFVAVNVNNLEIDFAILEDSGKIATRFVISALDRKTSDQYVSEIKNVFEYHIFWNRFPKHISLCSFFQLSIIFLYLCSLEYIDFFSFSIP